MKKVRNSLNDQELLDAYLNGNRRQSKLATNILYDRYKRKMIMLLKSKENFDEIECEDIYNNAVAVALVNIANGNFKRDSKYVTYLSGIVKNKALDQWRYIYRGRDKEEKRDIVFSVEDAQLVGIDERESSRSPEMIFAAKDLIEKVKALINSMTEKCKNILGLKGEGLGPTEISQQLTKAISTIKNGTGDCQKKLHALLRKDGELYGHLANYYDATRHAK